MHEDDATLPLVEETLVVGTRSVLTGRVRVETRTETVDTLAEALLEADSVEVSRIPIGRQVDDPPAVRTEGDLTIVPVLEEVLVVEKRLFLKEEIHIRRTRRQDRVEIPATLRRQHAVVERDAAPVEPAPLPPVRENPIATQTRMKPMTDIDTTYGTTGAGSTVSAFFDHREEAQAAIARLKDGGIPDGSISFTEGAAGGEGGERVHEPKGFFESLADFFMPADDRYVYAEGLSRGGYLVTVAGLSGADYDRAVDILDDEGAIDLDERSEAWRSEGWTGYDAAATAATGAVAAEQAAAYPAGDTISRAEAVRATDLGEDETVPVIEERLRVGKRDVSHGRVRVRSYVVEEPVSEEVELAEDRVCRRAPRGRPAALRRRRRLPRPDDRGRGARRGGGRLQGGARRRGDRHPPRARQPPRDRVRHDPPHRGGDRGRARRRPHRAREGRAHPLTRALAQTAGIEAPG